jgi:ComF family protein
MRKLLHLLDDFLGLFYPYLCLACQENAPPYGEDICTACRATMPETDFHLRKENPFTDRFWGRLPLEAGAAMYLFSKESRVQHLIHQLKYNGKGEIGEILGRQYGYSLKNSRLFAGVDLVVPVPLHPRKKRIRRYNQSALFAQGLSESMGVPLLENGLERLVHSESQTKKSRLKRFENVKEVFAVGKPARLTGKHILLVDDVLTTGSTLEACSQKILELPGTKVSLATIAITTHA